MSAVDPEVRATEAIKRLRQRAEAAEARLPTKRQGQIIEWFIKHPASVPPVPMREIEELLEKLR